MSEELKKRFTPDEVEQARKLDLFSYLRNCNPNELVEVNPYTYCTMTHDSLKISNGKWYWWSQGFGGVSALDYLIKVKNMHFTEAVRQILDIQPEIKKANITPLHQKSKSIFRLPYCAENNDKVIEYLKARGIDEDLITDCIGKKILYQEAKYSNCCFVGKDENGTPRYAMVRSTNPKSTFVQEIAGSEKAYSFRLTNQSKNKKLCVFESAIDLLSYATLNKEKLIDTNFLSLGGVYQNKLHNDKFTFPAALKNELERCSSIGDVTLCPDNDEVGKKKAAEQIKEVLGEMLKVKIELPNEKDFNADLMKSKGLTGIRTRTEKENTNEKVHSYSR